MKHKKETRSKSQPPALIWLQPMHALNAAALLLLLLTRIGNDERIGAVGELRGELRTDARERSGHGGGAVHQLRRAHRYSSQAQPVSKAEEDGVSELSPVAAFSHSECCLT